MDTPYPSAFMSGSLKAVATVGSWGHVGLQFEEMPLIARASTVHIMPDEFAL